MRIIRFDIYSRLMHWSHGLFFIWLMITGINLFFTKSSLLGDPLIRMVHIYASWFFILLPGMLFVIGSQSARKDVKELTSWNEDDTRWFLHFIKKNKPVIKGKFNGGQKANFTATLLLFTGLSFSGIVIWMKSMFSIPFVELNFLIHDSMAILAVLLLTGHLVFAIFYSESLRGIIFGEVDEKWAEVHYPVWKMDKIK
ncbi:MAG: cytochrome b/b6 domain-containing protein [Candidatus Methanoperedens sp.]|nr:cytochrome b/b6 domain-containing protein [Candidatus Methanoperedens sp.]